MNKKLVLLGSVPKDVGGTTMGGVARHVFDLAKYLSANTQYSVHILAQNVIDPDEIPIKHEDIKIWGVNKNVLLSSFLSTSINNIVQNYNWFSGFSIVERIKYYLYSIYCKQILADIDPDIIHVHHLHYLFPVAVIANKNAPIVTTAHSFNHCSHKEEYMEMARKAYGFADYIIFVSDKTRQEGRDLFGEFTGQSWIVPNGVDLYHYEPIDKEKAQRRIGYKSEEALIASAGTISRKKGFFELVDAIDYLRDRGKSYQVVIAGEGEDKDKLTEKIREKSLNEHIHLLGHVENMDLIYNAADVFVLPSHYESFGLVYIEAAACGTPSVGSTEVPEGIIDQTTGIRTEINNPDQLSNDIEKAINRDWNRDAIRNHAKKYSLDEVGKMCTKIYQDITKKHV